MDDLISRNALAEWVHANVPADTPAALITKSFVAAALSTKSITPSVPAVPLDKLCEWLNKNHGELPPCPFDEDCYECGLDGVACIKRRITAWMEGLDAAD